jgi:hypothetical protein
MHKCNSHQEWLANCHYFCSCGHVEWAHHRNGRCAHCNCTNYNGEERPLTEYELARINQKLEEPRTAAGSLD